MTEHAANVVDLEQFLAGDEPDFDADPTPPVDLDQAERWLRHVRRLTAELTQVVEVANAQRARIDLWESVETERLERRIAWFEQGLAAMHAAVLRDNPKGPKTLRLPSGQLKARGQQPEWEFDGPLFVAWAQRSRPALVNTPPPPAAKPDKAEAKARLRVKDPDAKPGDTVEVIDPLTGEVVPGVTVTIRGDKHWIELAADVDDVEAGDEAEGVSA